MSTYEIGDVNYRYGDHSSSREWLPCDGREISEKSFPILHPLLPKGTFQGEPYKWQNDNNGDSDVILTKGGVYAYKVENLSLLVSEDGGKTFQKLSDEEFHKAAVVGEDGVNQFKFLKYLCYKTDDGLEHEIMYSIHAARTLFDCICECGIVLDESGKISRIFTHSYDIQTYLDERMEEIELIACDDTHNETNKIVAVGMLKSSGSEDSVFRIPSSKAGNWHPGRTYQNETYATAFYGMGPLLGVKLFNVQKFEIVDGDFHIHMKDSIKVIKDIFNTEVPLKELEVEELDHPKHLPVIKPELPDFEKPVTYNGYTYYVEGTRLYKKKDGESPVAITVRESGVTYNLVHEIFPFYGSDHVVALTIQPYSISPTTILMKFNLETETGFDLGRFYMSKGYKLFKGANNSVDTYLQISQEDDQRIRLEFVYQGGGMMTYVNGTTWQVNRDDSRVYIYTDQSVSYFNDSNWIDSNFVHIPTSLKTYDMSMFIKARNPAGVNDSDLVTDNNGKDLVAGKNGQYVYKLVNNKFNYSDDYGKTFTELTVAQLLQSIPYYPNSMGYSSSTKNYCISLRKLDYIDLEDIEREILYLQVDYLHYSSFFNAHYAILLDDDGKVEAYLQYSASKVAGSLRYEDQRNILIPYDKGIMENNEKICGYTLRKFADAQNSFSIRKLFIDFGRATIGNTRFVFLGASCPLGSIDYNYNDSLMTVYEDEYFSYDDVKGLKIENDLLYIFLSNGDIYSFDFITKEKVLKLV